MNKIILTIALFFSSHAWAGTAYYVDPGAVGGGTGTYASPWNSIAQVNSKVFSPGDDVYFKAGTTLTMTANLLIDWHGTDADPVVIGAYYGDGLFGLNGGARPILLGSHTTPIPSNENVGLIDYVGVGYITVQDVHVKKSYGIGIQLMQNYFSDGRRSVYNVVRNCIAEDNGRQGVILARCSYSVVEDCLIDGSSQIPTVTANGVRYSGAGIEVTGMNRETSVYNVVRGNTVRRAGESIGNYLGARYTLIENNIVYDIARAGIYAANSRDGIIRNNVVYMSDGIGTPNPLPDWGRRPLIWVDCEGHIASMIMVNGGWQIYGNYVAGGSRGIWLQNNANDYGYPVYLVDTKVYNNRIVDCDANIYINTDVTGWTGNEIHDNYSFIFTAGLQHVYGESPVGVTWADNHYNTTIDGVSGNAATSAVYDDPDLIKTTGWRALPTDGTVDSTWWAFTTEPSDPPPSESALLASNTYGGATYTPTLAFLFDDATGTTLTDHSGNEAHATLTNPTWSANGLDMSTVGQKIAAPVPNMSGSATVFIAFTSLETTGIYQGKFYFYNNYSNYTDWQLERLDTDQIVYGYVGGKGFQWEPTPDNFDQYFHTMMATYNDTSDTVCIYIDGNFQSCQTSTFAFPTWTGSFYIGSRNDGSRILNATLHAFYIWPNVLTAADAAALFADYDQMFTDPPSRTFNLSTPEVPAPALHRVTTTISTMPVVTTRSQ